MPQAAKKTAKKSAPSRKEKALATRRRIVAAAYRMFSERGFVAITMEAVAAEAGVAVQTMYFSFGTKMALLREAFESAVLGSETPTPPRETAWYRAFVAEPDPSRALAHIVDNATEINERVGGLLSIFESLSHDHEAIAFHRRTENLRDEGYREIIRVLSRKGDGLRRGLTLARATDVLYVVLGPEHLRRLRARGWTLAECKRWLARVLASELLDRGDR